MNYLYLFVFGIILGSFINALVWRIHTERKWWGNERSMCPHCKHTLSAKDLIPVLSWLMLKGHCRYCKKRISIQYPLVELATGLLFAGSYLYWPYELSALGVAAMVLWLAVLLLLIALFVYDLKWMLLPNKIVLSVTILTILLVFVLTLVEDYSIVATLLGGMVLVGLFWLLFQASNGKWIGGGDVKLAFALGLLAGTPLKALLVLFLASLIGTVLVVPLLIVGKSKITAKIPFGPLLIIATIIVFFFGQCLIDWYTRTLLYY